jgi:hypothetical protein
MVSVVVAVAGCSELWQGATRRKLIYRVEPQSRTLRIVAGTTRSIRIGSDDRSRNLGWIETLSWGIFGIGFGFPGFRGRRNFLGIGGALDSWRIPGYGLGWFDVDVLIKGECWILR